ncbi:hypothetical protein MHSWG343_10080 [Candidatus Mycoplasma haematohominis]|uniref:Uncharacterized protein n=1 Tax=Candidatus Mycoplasma haematohominis TaxID=1494318 RepID=A0A478FVE9_9MOLU|nr:hypothetical protein MHSWG343_10080 [Candidatus Mycoplasma haemohominis]
MSAAVKGAAALGATAVIVGGTGVGAKFLLDAQEPHCVRLAEPTQDKYGKDYYRYFAESNGSVNDKWWNWVFKNRYEKDKRDSSANKHEPLSKFKDLESGSGVDKSLKKVCGKAYSSNASDVVAKDQVVNDNNKYSEDDIWRYCSIFGNKPKTLKEVSPSVSRDVNKFEKEKETDLIDIEHEKNKKFWEEQDEYFFSLEESEITGNQDSLFKSLHNKKSNRSKNDTVKNTCKLAYKEPKTSSSDSAKVTSDVLLKFCSLKGK